MGFSPSNLKQNYNDQSNKKTKSLLNFEVDFFGFSSSELKQNYNYQSNKKIKSFPENNEIIVAKTSVEKTGISL